MTRREMRRVCGLCREARVQRQRPDRVHSGRAAFFEAVGTHLAAATAAAAAAAFLVRPLDHSWAANQVYEHELLYSFVYSTSHLAKNRRTKIRLWPHEFAAARHYSNGARVQLR